MIPFMARQILETSDQTNPASFVLFLLIWLTDLFDGFIARKFNMESELGKILDPAVDKIFQITTAFCFYLIDYIPLFVPVILISKDLILVLGGLYLFTKRQDTSSKLPGRISTFLSAIGFALLFILEEAHRHFARYLIYLSIFISFVAFFVYLHIFIAYKCKNKTQI
ncbi:MAG: hypothetical protein GX326_08010 [Clostridiaceae bacterium]|nr:hypothetical protein [Clostridiaceae bacterium]